MAACFYICRQKGIQFKLGTSDELFPALNADIDRLNQILSIFIDNAINYSLPKSEISLDATIFKNTLVFSIKDHGTGIPHLRMAKYSDSK